MIELQDIRKIYRMGETRVEALRGVSLGIEPGEFVAITGPSGSGKSTLMHVIGLLDVPDSGSYRLLGRETAHLPEDDLAVLRREAIGFVFQQFNLLPRVSAAENVAMPLLYSRHDLDMVRAEKLLTQVGLADRVRHKSNELSGGQQQRVAIARALVNEPRIILADEPTGNLDTASQKEIMEVLKQLNREGITIVIVTHEEEIAREARRRIRMRDGVIQSDDCVAKTSHASSPPSPNVRPPDRWRLQEIGEHLRQGLRALASNKVRTALSMLGILIGVAAVVAMLALGRGAQKAIETQLASLGSNLLVLRQGAVRVGGVAQEAGATTRLSIDDVAAIKERIAGVKQASPSVRGRARVSFGNRNWNTQILGTGPEYEHMRAARPQLGRFFTEAENQRRTRVALIGLTVVRELFGGQNPLGEYIKLNKINFQVIGILPEKGANAWNDQDDIVVIPTQTAMYRLLGKNYVDYIDIEAVSADQLESIIEDAKQLMLVRHRVPPSLSQDAFEVRNLADIQATMAESSRTMSFLLATIAGISLLVGGIGIMNIMLVSVTERTREIGLRKAVGARRRDILSQFLVETLVVSLIGGFAGIAVGWIMTVMMSAFAGWSASITADAVLLAFLFSAGIGIVFGIYPARKAAGLNPIEALRYE
ncbi:MAG: ABC transporter permease [Sulfuricaulis sp.]|uniref:ABC transporter permease n=1 Tax=Sulfuricaulis sp. TaxID=2003553 RepID=UPI0025DA9F7D|nr:ABC transporter permease [Sulfuricaulis sp.]MCR4347959.1 ABC transporter permease [Sulfuricaulis sp.]